RHVAGPGTVDVIKILEVRLIQIGFERLLKGGAGLREHAVERVEKILGLRHSVVTVVRESRLLAGRQSGGEIARGEARAEHQIASAHRHDAASAASGSGPSGSRSACRSSFESP